MALDVTGNRLALLSAFDGDIGLEGDMGTEEIVIRLNFHNQPDLAEDVYNSLVDAGDIRCNDRRNMYNDMKV